MLLANMYEAKTHLSSLIQKALDGEEVVIAKSGRPLVELVPYPTEKKQIKFGMLKGQISIPDDFDSFDDQVADIFSEYIPDDK